MAEKDCDCPRPRPRRLGPAPAGTRCVEPARPRARRPSSRAGGRPHSGHQRERDEHSSRQRVQSPLRQPRSRARVDAGSLGAGMTRSRSDASLMRSCRATTLRMSEVRSARREWRSVAQATPNSVHRIMLANVRADSSPDVSGSGGGHETRASCERLCRYWTVTLTSELVGMRR